MCSGESSEPGAIAMDFFFFFFLQVMDNFFGEETLKSTSRWSKVSIRSEFMLLVRKEIRDSGMDLSLCEHVVI